MVAASFTLYPVWMGNSQVTLRTLPEGSLMMHQVLRQRGSLCQKEKTHVWEGEQHFVVKQLPALVPELKVHEMHEIL